MDWRHHPKTQLAAKALLRGEVVAYPTEAVWGLGCLPDNHHAIDKILKLKKRPVDKGLILAAGDISQIAFLIEGLSKEKLSALENSWPGHCTWLIPHKNLISPKVSGKFDTVAVRVSTHPMIQALCSLVGGPIVSTSANPAGLSPAREAYRVKQYFGEQLVYAPGQVGCYDQPSKIRDLISGETIRA